MMTLFITHVGYVWFERLFALRLLKSPQPALIDRNLLHHTAVV